jgi:hypothetical protein
MDLIKDELLQDMVLDVQNSCHQCIIGQCDPDECEWDDGDGGIIDQPRHRETILKECYRIGGISLYAKWKEKLKFGLNIDDDDDYPEFFQLIDHSLWNHEDCDKFEGIIRYCSERRYNIFQSKYIHDPFYMDHNKFEICKKYGYNEPSE